MSISPAIRDYLNSLAASRGKPSPIKARQTSDVIDTTSCTDCRRSCDKSDRDKDGNYRCRTCGIRYLDECTKAAIESHRKEKR